MQSSADMITKMTWVARSGLDLLVIFNVVGQLIAVLVLLMGPQGAKILPVAGGALVALFLLMFFYACWMFPGLKKRHVLAVLALKELGIFTLLGIAVGLVILLRWIF